MSSSAQIAANQANAQRSTGPKTPQGLAASAKNNLRHGLAGAFMVLRWEKQENFDALFESLRNEHAPSTPTENLLVERMAQHYWLSQRAIRCQNACLADGFPKGGDDKGLALYIRYQTTHERGFHKSLNDLLKLRAEKRRQEIGFESQERKREEENRRRNREERHQNEEIRKEAGHVRREAAEKRKQELHRWNVLLAEAKFDHQGLQSDTLRLNIALASPDDEGEDYSTSAEKAA
jgi:hypothetical protein